MRAQGKTARLDRKTLLATSASRVTAPPALPIDLPKLPPVAKSTSVAKIDVVIPDELVHEVAERLRTVTAPAVVQPVHILDLFAPFLGVGHGLVLSLVLDSAFRPSLDDIEHALLTAARFVKAALPMVSECGL